MEENIYTKLLHIQTNMRCNKSQYNKFADFNYRSCEDILNALKRFLKETNCVILLNDDLVELNGRYYIKATAKLIDCTNGKEISNVAYAREEYKDGKKMSEPQFTGSSSSYARKYALNGLLALDDANDPDNEINYTQEQPKAKAKTTTTKTVEKPQEAQAPVDDAKARTLKARDELVIFCKGHGVDMKALLGMYQCLAKAPQEAQFKMVLEDLKKHIPEELMISKVQTGGAK